MTKTLLMVLLAGALAGCASPNVDQQASQDPPRLPTTRYVVQVTHTPDEIRLAPHATGLSQPQAAAVEDLVARWRDAGDGPVTIQAPSAGGSEAYRSASAVQGALLKLGVQEAQIRVVSYQPEAGAAVQPIVVGFTRYEAHGPQCGRDWKDYTKTFTNQTNSNFGCAVTANFAAMLANPSDLTAERKMDPADANRRETILGHYRKGETSSSAKDSQASGAVSSVLQ
jgi:pilus assembly protein CpaD